MFLESLQEIEIGNQFTFFYPSTEWKMEQPFTCICGYAKCIGLIEGAFALNKTIL